MEQTDRFLGQIVCVSVLNEQNEKLRKMTKPFFLASFGVVESIEKENFECFPFRNSIRYTDFNLRTRLT